MKSNILNFFALILATASALAQAAPLLGSFSATKSGDKIIVSGSNFDAVVANNTVNFPGANGSSIAVTPTEGTTYSLTAVIPTGTMTGNITVSTGGQTSNPSSNKLRFIADKASCAAAGFTSSATPGPYYYCIFPNGFSDNSADVLIIAAASSGSVKYNMLSTSRLEKSKGLAVTLNGTIITQYNTSNGNYGMLTVNSTSTGTPDTFNNAGKIIINGQIMGRGNFNNQGTINLYGNGTIQNSGIFTNTASGKLVLGSTGNLIDNAGFTNNVGLASVRGTLNNSGTIATLDGSSPGIINVGSDIINQGTLTINSKFGLTNRQVTGSSPSKITNQAPGTITLSLITDIGLSNENGAWIRNNGTLTNTVTVKGSAVQNNGTILQCGTWNGPNATPNQQTTQGCTP